MASLRAAASAHPLVGYEGGGAEIGVPAPAACDSCDDVLLLRSGCWQRLLHLPATAAAWRAYETGKYKENK